jgi:hypothetical protein
MRFKAQYRYIIQAGTALHQEPDCWRTLDADDLTDAQFLAKRFTPKGYRLIYLTQDEDYNL